MVYSKKVYDKAEEEINKRRTHALEVFESHQNQINASAPEIAELNRRLANTSVQISRAILSKSKNIADAIENIKESNLKGQRDIREMLKAFGYDEDFLDLKYHCNICSDTGFSGSMRCECFNTLLKKYSTEELNKLCAITLSDFNEITTDFYPNALDGDGINPHTRMTALIEYCDDYTNKFSDNSPSLFFIGKTGLGKTMISSAMAKRLVERGFNVVFDSIQNFLRAIENEHFGRSLETDTFQILMDADLIILDDLGTEFSTPFNQSTIYNIINSRLNRCLPMIISTNLSFDAINKKYDERIISRLTGMFTTLRFFGKDIRQIKRMMNR